MQLSDYSYWHVCTHTNSTLRFIKYFKQQVLHNEQGTQNSCSHWVHILYGLINWFKKRSFDVYGKKKKKKRNQYGIPRILSNSGWLLCYLVCYFVCLFVFGVHSLAADVSPMWWDWEEWESRGGKAWWIWCLLKQSTYWFSEASPSSRHYLNGKPRLTEARLGGKVRNM